MVSQLLGVILMIGTVILPHDMQVGNTWSYWGHGFYLSFQKMTFTLGIYLLVLPTLLEIPTISFFLLDTKFFNFTGKISFCVYLMHLMVVERICFIQKVDFYYNA
jgi:peptidoglycan/LPS O-acetylase OafA/YrhL